MVRNDLYRQSQKYIDETVNPIATCKFFARINKLHGSYRCVEYCMSAQEEM